MSRTISLNAEAGVIEDFARHLVEGLGWPWAAPSQPKPPRSVTDAIGDYLWYDWSDEERLNHLREGFQDDYEAFADWIAGWEF